MPTYATKIPANAKPSSLSNARAAPSPAAAAQGVSAKPTPQNALHQQLNASEAARAQLRDALLSYLRSTPEPTPWPCAATPDQLWAIPKPTPEPPASAAPEPPRLLVGDAPTLLASLRELSRCCHELSKACHALPAPSPVELHDDGLNWLRSLTMPAARFEPLRGDRDAQILDLLRLRCASLSKQANPSFDALPHHAKREVAFDLARSLPYFDRDLTAFYLSGSHPPCALPFPEYELHAAHSLLRLAPADTTLDHFATRLHPTWREAGLLHVLAVAAVHMPSASVDWRLPSPCPTTTAVQSLLQALPGARSHTDAARVIARFIANAPAYAGTPMDKQAIARFTHTLDRMAALMRVKSDAPAADPRGHCLDTAIAAHLPPPDKWTDDVRPELLVSLWSSVKPALERALPPSALLPIEGGGGGVSAGHFW